jgi:serine acetyltransferase
VYLGSNSSVREKTKITDDIIVGLNSGVVKNITESGTYVGVPAKRIK